MTALAWLVPVALFLGAVGLAAFLWSLRTGQFEDLEGAAYRALEDDEPEDDEVERKEPKDDQPETQRSNGNGDQEPG